MDSHPSTLAFGSAPDGAHHPKTVVVVVVVAVVVVAVGRATVVRIVVPATAPESGSPNPFFALS
jgi:hypothetical protein